MSGYSLIVNAGSATYKYGVFRGRKKMVAFIYQKEGEKKWSFQKNGAEKISISKEAFENSLSDLKKREKKMFDEIEAMAFRVVHGGNDFYKPTLLTQSVFRRLQKLHHLAPLHNPYALKMMKQAMKILPKTKKLLVFDTAFHHDLPEVNKLYALPKEIVKKMSLRRFGFHGIICSAIVHQMSWRLPKRTIICHLGSGSSVTAVYKGKSIDTSMGYTPLEGLMMATRAGDLDPGVLLQLQKNFGMEKTEKMLNKESGLKALTGSSDMREILKRAEKKNAEAVQALEMFCRKIAKYIAAYTISLGGLDRIIFSGGIGENAPWVRQKICEYLKPHGVRIHHSKNLHAKIGQNFQGFFSKVKLNYLHADEEAEMNRILQREV